MKDLVTNLAIYEIIGLILSLPLSYVIAYLAKKYSNATYKDELNRLFLAYWDGEEEKELYAWLKVKQLLSGRNLDKKRSSYIEKQIRNLNKSGIYGASSVNSLGELEEREGNSKLEETL